MAILEKISSPEDLKALSMQECLALCGEIRRFLVGKVSKTGGHLASNLGVVELTIALHRVFSSPEDKIVFDVGHQTYVHKMLTGRKEGFERLRSFGGMSGFPKPSESEHDPFIVGHASTSISACLGMARARTLMGEDCCAVAVIGDGALTGGLAYEALEDAGQSGEPLTVILNDNGMSIRQNVGGMAMHLATLRLSPGYFRLKNAVRTFTLKMPGGKTVYRAVHNTKAAIKDALFPPGSMFENMGFTYLGPIDGHDLPQLCEILSLAKKNTGPTLVHISTVKGKGYKYSEESPHSYHGIASFDIGSGRQHDSGGKSFSSVFGSCLAELGRDGRVCAITAAMQSGVGLDDFAGIYPERFFDVGIAEQHAVTMAAGLAAQGMIPVCAIYSTFLQRAYDQIIHDVAIQKLHVVFAVDRAGLVGEDGETHQGIFDAVFLCQIPNMKVLCPASFEELGVMLKRAVFECGGPVAVRYPRGAEGERFRGVSSGASEVLQSGEDVTLVSYGTLINEALEAGEKLRSEGISCDIVKLNTIAPLDIGAVFKSAGRTGRLIVVEDCVEAGSVGQRIGAAIASEGGGICRIRLLNAKESFVTHGSVRELRSLLGIDSDAICKAAREMQ